MDVGRAEVVTPFRDAMGLVDSDTRELPLDVDGVDVSAEGLGECVLWGKVQQAGTRVP